MPDEPKWSQPGYRPPAAKPTPGELMFEFVRLSDKAPMTAELRFYGQRFEYGWEVQLLARGEPFMSHGAFMTKAAGNPLVRGDAESDGEAKWMEPLPIRSNNSARH